MEVDIMVNAIAFTSNACWFFHKWKTKKTTGFTRYQECVKCKSRRIVQSHGGYQPLNLDFLKAVE